MATSTLPASVNTAATTGNSKDEQAVLDHLKSLKQESMDTKKKLCSEEDDKEALRLYRGNFGPTDRTNYFSCDFIQMFIDRMVAQLTDSRPVLRVENKKAGLKKMAKGLEKVMQGVWIEEDMQRHTYRMCHNSAIRRSSGIYVGYDHLEDKFILEPVLKDQVWIDPNIVEASQIDRAEYVIIERIKTCDELKVRFPLRGALVKQDDVSYSGEASGITVKSPVTNLLKAGTGKGKLTSVIPRARVYEAFLKDRQVNAKGDKLFPYGRRIIYTQDMVLWDGPIPFWDGGVPLDWFDWSVDPEHPWGISAPMTLKRLQLAFNEILDGTVTNHILSNFIGISGEADALDPAQWKNLQQISNSLIIRNQKNKPVTITPPPAFGADKLNMAKTLFTYGQLLTGVTDVTLGEHPGSVQSGQAIEGLQEGANLMTRSRASRLEDFYARVGNKLMARILQFWPSDRVFHLLGPTDEATAYAMNRKELFMDDDNLPIDSNDRREIFRYLRFAILPGSSTPGTRAKRAEMMVKLHMIGCASRKMVLQAADFNDPDQMLKEAEDDFKVFPPAGFERKKTG